MVQNNNRLPRSLGLVFFGAISMIVILLSGLVVISSPLSANATHRLNIPNSLFTPPNQGQSVPKGQSIPQGLNIPKNLIVAPVCSQQCPPIIGTQKDDIIIATGVTDATIYGLGGNDFIQCGPGACKAFGGPGDNILVASTSSTTDNAKLYGGSGNNIFIGGVGSNLMVGGKGNDQFFAGTGHDVMVGGGGANFFDCGLNGNGVILDFNPANGDTKASNCKFVVTVHSNANNNPGSTLPAP
jgi:Ca2+-binding RTX toxin-like protein